jgi:hypothetical protein
MTKTALRRYAARCGTIATAAALALGAFTSASGVASTSSSVSPTSFAGAPAEASPASTRIYCVGCVYHSSYYGREWGYVNCDIAGAQGQLKGYWSEYGCFSRDYGSYHDLRVRWNA